MEFYNEKDMEYWRKQAEEGNAIILEIPVELLLELDLNEIQLPENRTISPEEVQAVLDLYRKEYELIHTPRSNAEPGTEPDTEPDEGPDAEMHPEGKRETGKQGSEKKQEDSDEEKVTRIMSETAFSDEQIAVIAQAMLDRLPARYLLCFLKKEYSADTMLQMYEYCRKMYAEEKKMGTPESG